MYVKFARAYEDLLHACRTAAENPNSRKLHDVEEFERKFFDALDDDMNTPKALAAFNRFIRWLNGYLNTEAHDKCTLERALEFFNKFIRITGVLEKREEEEIAEKLLTLIITVRKELRKRRIFDLSDYIREELRKLGFEVEDIGLETRVRVLR